MADQTDLAAVVAETRKWAQMAPLNILRAVEQVCAAAEQCAKLREELAKAREDREYIEMRFDPVARERDEARAECAAQKEAGAVMTREVDRLAAAYEQCDDELRAARAECERLRGELDSERDSFRREFARRDELYVLRTQDLELQVKRLMDPIVQAKLMQPPPPIIMVADEKTAAELRARREG